MSYTRLAWARVYTKGESNLYSYWDASDMIVMITPWGDTKVEREDVLEFIVSVLGSAGVELTDEQIRKLAEYLEVELREKPLSWEERLEDMIRRTGGVKDECESPQASQGV